MKLESGFLLAAVVLGLASSARTQQTFQHHLDQNVITQLVSVGQAHRAFVMAFEGGDEGFEFAFAESDGVGANIGGGRRFSRTPRMDLGGPAEWASHSPSRFTGPNEQSCTSCHSLPVEDGAGGIAHNVVRDPLRLGDPSKFIERQTPHLLGSGAVQRLAEEMTADLHAIRDQAAIDACLAGASVTRPLSSKGVAFGSITAVPGAVPPCEATFDTSGVVGVSADLVVRPFGWKGDTAFLRAFSRNAAHQELGMQPVELVGDGVDADFDGVADETTIGDVTGLVIYNSGQPRPLSLIELDKYDLVGALSPGQIAQIRRGKTVFLNVGCAVCHVPALTLADPVFSEPSQNPHFRDATLPNGQDPLTRGLSPALAVQYDLTVDLPDNVVTHPITGATTRLGNFLVNVSGQTVVELFGDLKRHDMGPGLAEPVDEIGTGASVWLTENLWGVGSTAPYLHDGRAVTLPEAILLHGGEAQAARDAYAALSPAQKADILAFLNSLVLAKTD